MNLDITLSLIRHLLTLAGGIAVSKGYLTTDLLEVVVGAILTLGGAFWGVAQKIEKPKTIVVQQPVSAKPSVTPGGAAAAFTQNPA